MQILLLSRARKYLHQGGIYGGISSSKLSRPTESEESWYPVTGEHQNQI